MTGSVTIMEVQRKDMFKPAKAHAQNNMTTDSDMHARFSSTEAAGHKILVVVQSTSVIFLLLVSILSRNKILEMQSGVGSVFGNVTKGTVVAAHVDMRRARGKVRVVLVTFLVLATARVTLVTVKLAARTIQKLDLVHACVRVGVFFAWNLILPMVTSWLTIVYGFVLILGNAFGILAEELEREGQARLSRRVEEILDHARGLREVLEEMNETLKIPMVGLFIFMIITLTVSIFFGAVGASKNWQMVVFCLLTLAIYMLAIYVLSSAGEEVVNQARRYGEALGRVEAHTEAYLQFRVRN